MNKIFWRYEDRLGKEHKGFIRCINDFGGTDIAYTFEDSETGEVNVISGSLLKKARRIWD